MARRPRQMAIDFDHNPITQESIDALVAEMQAVYLRDDRPWVIGFSGGKDSTAVTQLAYRALMALPPEKRAKPVYVISSDTLVENPTVAEWLDKCHAELRRAASDYNLPVQVVKVTPDPAQSFWVCLIGRGYPAPTQDFRWCTGRLKIEPSERWVRQNIDPDGRILQLLGSRRKESAARGRSIEAHAIEGKFGTTGSLTNGISYQPIQEWDNDNVWEYLRLFPTPWNRPNDVVWIPDPTTGQRLPNYNNELFAMYQDAHGGECVLEFDRRTATCGGSRFGCWTCTVVPEDTSMTNMVEMTHPQFRPLLEFRNKIQRYRNDYSLRDRNGRNGRIRLNSHARDAAAQEACADREGCVEAFAAGAKWAERDHYKPTGQTLEEAAQALAPEYEADFVAGATWSRIALAEGTTNDSVTPGPYLMHIRAELLRDLFLIEKALPGYRTVTDDDLHWIRYHWERDGGDPDLVDRLWEEVFG